MNVLKVLKNGIIDENPTFIQVIGMCPTPVSYTHLDVYKRQVSGIEESLTRRIGISENLNTPPEGQSRLPLAANIRHALYYCFQGQDEIAAKNFLFHRQSDDFITQAIKDTIPYFFGAISEEALALENERSILKRKLTLEKRKLEENRYLMGGGSERAIALIGEARQAGLIAASAQIDYQNYQGMYSILQTAMNWSPSRTGSNSGMDRLTFLQSKLQEIRDEFDEIGISLEKDVYKRQVSL